MDLSTLKVGDRVEHRHNQITEDWHPAVVVRVDGIDLTASCGGTRYCHTSNATIRPLPSTPSEPLAEGWSEVPEDFRHWTCTKETDDGLECKRPAKWWVNGGLDPGCDGWSGAAACEAHRPIAEPPKLTEVASGWVSPPTPQPKRAHRFDRYVVDCAGRQVCLNCGFGAPSVLADECGGGMSEAVVRRIVEDAAADETRRRQAIPFPSPPRPEPYSGTLNGSAGLACGMRGRR